MSSNDVRISRSATACCTDWCTARRCTKHATDAYATENGFPRHKQDSTSTYSADRHPNRAVTGINPAWCRFSLLCRPCPSLLPVAVNDVRHAQALFALHLLMSQDDDGWTVVGKDGKFWWSEQGSSAAGRNSASADTAHLAQAATSTAPGSLQHVLKLQKALEGSDFYASVRAAIDQSGIPQCTICLYLGSFVVSLTNEKYRPTDFKWAKVQSIRCYGLGRPTKTVEARCQLALLKILSTSLGPEQCECWVYDPVFEAVDVEVCGQLGVTVISADEAEEHGVSEPTLFYMPHCDSTLYSDVLDKNWSASALENVAILGNSFAHMQVRSRLCNSAV